MMIRKSGILLLACVIIFSGCLTIEIESMPERLDNKIANLGGKALVLASFTFNNELDRFNSTDKSIREEFLIGRKKGDEYDKIHLFSPKNIIVQWEDRPFSLIVIDINDGDNYFYSIRGMIDDDFYHPLFEAPMLMDFQVKGNEIQYIGNINLTLRRKNSKSEHRAGPIMFPTDQAPILNATFDVKIVDEYERDIKEFKKIFMNIKEYEIKKRILPSWKRPTKDEFKPKKSGMSFW